MFWTAIEKNGVKRSVVVLTDGHSSCFDVDVMRFCRKNSIHQHVGLADASEIIQLLKQIFSNLHTAYSAEKDAMFDGDREVGNRMHILGEIWDTWTSEEKILKVARRVGIKSSGINIHNMQTVKFQ